MTDKVRILAEDAVGDTELDVPAGHDLYYIKLIGIGPKTLAQNDAKPATVVEATKGFYIIAPLGEIETSLISIIQRAFADRRKQLEADDGSTK